MKLLFDQNLSPKLATFFEESISGSRHLKDIGLDASDDRAVWGFAQQNGFTIVPKDSDFNNLVSFFGFPPKIIWIRRGNCTTTTIQKIMIENLDTIKVFIDDLDNGILSIL